MNVVILIGRFTTDPKTNEKTTACRFTLAVDRRYKTENGENADFIGCVAFGKTAKFIDDYFTKGMKIAITGRIQTCKYNKQDGSVVYTEDVVVETCDFVEKKGEKQPVNEETDDFTSIPNDMELPFV